MVRLEVNDCPGTAFQEGQIDDTFDQYRVTEKRNRCFASALAALRCLPGPIDQRVRQDGHHSYRCGLDLFLRRPDNPRLLRHDTLDLFRSRVQRDYCEHGVDQHPEPQTSRADTAVRDINDYESMRQ